MEIGEKIRELRLKNGLTQGELADRCELTKGYISQLENELTSPSISTLKDILASLGSSLKEFFADDDDSSLVFGEGDYFEKDSGDSAIKWLVPSAQKNLMEPILFTLSEGASSSKDLPHDGEEFGYVLKGTLKLIVGRREFKLIKGNSFYFKSDKTHYVVNDGKGEATLIWVSCPPNF